ncbi:2-polyprenyl-6-hydroxyphenyl methylase/3-demethylubiquinone-9 3-methyltransferase [Chitinivorax tropicus]|uniref:Ubiquinone biosynthesis O-methyltransferase n=1 Tax=Chitinivorax tropicus TaxID=714531 RepID=A0A840MLV2_9PROT|nr:bifunctional 2-polyprenyl-6-hydroxyphenol methylase/3-demethylubiquinol 3-O-methyltransferase UbiG [Chitinivorax tropicus]MBB5019618.1 2-polyprenyl-6-hydroxyphenyl methylase/3-demethylubiquinone-9 3-methyltransferase [Chitinivorax tropicus]
MTDTRTPNVDDAEIAKFSELAHKWWDKESEFKPLHQINPLRLGYIQEFSPLSGHQVIDVGCGGGILSEALSEQGATVTGIDLAEKSLKVAKLHLLESGNQVEYRCIAAEDMATQHPAQFDVVTCMELLEHVPSPDSVVQACAQLAKPGGWVFFSTISRNPKAYLQAILGAEYLLGLLPRGTHEYARFLKPSELSRMARHAGLEVVDVRGMGYNLLDQTYHLSNQTDVNYMMACRKANP